MGVAAKRLGGDEKKTEKIITKMRNDSFLEDLRNESKIMRPVFPIRAFAPVSFRAVFARNLEVKTETLRVTAFEMTSESPAYTRSNATEIELSVAFILTCSLVTHP